MAGEEDEVAHLQFLTGDLPHREAFLQAGIPVDDNAVQEVGGGHQTGTVNTLGGLAAPAVVGALKKPGGLHQTAAQLLFRQIDGSFIEGIQPACPDITFPAIGELYLLPTLLSLADHSQNSTAGNSEQFPALDLGVGLHVTGVLVENHFLGQGLPLLHPVGTEVFHSCVALITVMGAHLPILFGGLFQNLHYHAAQGLVGPLAVVGRLRAQRANGGRYNGFHRESPP